VKQVVCYGFHRPVKLLARAELPDRHRESISPTTETSRNVVYIRSFPTVRVGVYLLPFIRSSFLSRSAQTLALMSDNAKRENLPNRMQSSPSFRQPTRCLFSSSGRLDHCIRKDALFNPLRTGATELGVDLGGVDDREDNHDQEHERRVEDVQEDFVGDEVAVVAW
jgi:hypothetical protein